MNIINTGYKINSVILVKNGWMVNCYCGRDDFVGKLTPDGKFEILYPGRCFTARTNKLMISQEDKEKNKGKYYFFDSQDKLTDELSQAEDFVGCNEKYHSEKFNYCEQEIIQSTLLGLAKTELGVGVRNKEDGRCYLFAIPREIFNIEKNENPSKYLTYVDFSLDGLTFTVCKYAQKNILIFDNPVY